MEADSGRLSEGRVHSVWPTESLGGAEWQAGDQTCRSNGQSQVIASVSWKLSQLLCSIRHCHPQIRYFCVHPFLQKRFLRETLFSSCLHPNRSSREHVVCGARSCCRCLSCRRPGKHVFQALHRGLFRVRFSKVLDFWKP